MDNYFATIPKEQVEARFTFSIKGTTNFKFKEHYVLINDGLKTITIDLDKVKHYTEGKYESKFTIKDEFPALEDKVSYKYYTYHLSFILPVEYKKNFEVKFPSIMVNGEEYLMPWIKYTLEERFTILPINC